jgi:hypothetical protein
MGFLLTTSTEGNSYIKDIKLILTKVKEILELLDGSIALQLLTGAALVVMLL